MYVLEWVLLKFKFRKDSHIINNKNKDRIDEASMIGRSSASTLTPATSGRVYQLLKVPSPSRMNIHFLNHSLERNPFKVSRARQKSSTKKQLSALSVLIYALT